MEPDATRKLCAAWAGSPMICGVTVVPEVRGLKSGERKRPQAAPVAVGGSGEPQTGQAKGAHMLGDEKVKLFLTTTAGMCRLLSIRVRVFYKAGECSTDAEAVSSTRAKIAQTATPGRLAALDLSTT